MRFNSFSSVKVNIPPLWRQAMLSLGTVVLLCCSTSSVCGQKLNGAQEGETIVPLERLLSRPVKLKPDLVGQHPRVFFTAESLAKLRERARTEPYSELWRNASLGKRIIHQRPLLPGSPELDRSGHGAPQYRAAYALAELTLAYAIEQDPKLLETAKQWLAAIIQYEPWGYTFSKPNTDLPAAHFLYAVGLAYDTLYHQLTEDERTAVRRKLVRQGNLMYDYFRYKPKKTYAYSQNHTGIPQAGLAVAAFALLGEEKDAEHWAQLSRALYDRILSTFGTDGYYYEGFHYYVFSLHWIVRYLDALEHATGEDLYPRMRERFVPMKYYAAHSILPGGDGVFDFGDTGKGAADRNRETPVKLNTGYEVLYRFASKYRDEQAQGVAQWLRKELRTETWEGFWAFYSYDASLRAAPITSISSFYHFEDNGTIFWRSNWSKDATAVAFRCGPPEGHRVAALKPRIPEWRLSTGHAHPDANSFIIYANGRYLTGDTGYVGVKFAADHNTVLVDGRGHAEEGQHHIYKDVPYERLDQIRISERVLAPDHFYARGEAAAAYFPELGVERFTRHFLFVAPDYFLIWDELEAKDARPFSWLINADRKIEQLAPSRFLIANQPAALLVERLVPASAEVKIEPQIVIGQGRPGSVDKGEPEVRGFQLIERTAEKVRQAEFLHFLQPTLVTDPRPKVTALADSAGRARGIRVEWSTGNIDWALLRGSTDELTTDGERAVLRLGRDLTWQRIILHRGTRLVHKGTAVLRVDQPVTASLETKGETWRGLVSATSPTEVIVSVRRKPRVLLINGSSVTPNYDEAARTVTFSVGSGGSQIEAE